MKLLVASEAAISYDTMLPTPPAASCRTISRMLLYGFGIQVT
jgi:hypothetical protein